MEMAPQITWILPTVGGGLESSDRMNPTTTCPTGHASANNTVPPLPPRKGVCVAPLNEMLVGQDGPASIAPDSTEPESSTPPDPEMTLPPGPPKPAAPLA